jgi:hypothetical protein
MRLGLGWVKFKKKEVLEKPQDLGELLPQFHKFRRCSVLACLY